MTVVLSQRGVVLLTVATGVFLELGTQVVSGRREAWDSELYWTLGLPIAGMAAIAIGFLSRRREWLWTLLLVPSQVMTMMLTSGEIGGLFPLALVLAVILSLPFVAVAFVASRFRRST
jgi:hypothetical protein